MSEVQEQIARLETQVAEAERNHEQADADEAKAWRVNETRPRDPVAYSDATMRRVRWHNAHLRYVGALVDQKKLLAAVIDPLEQEFWLAEAADRLRGE